MDSWISMLGDQELHGKLMWFG
ncbi:hypothetical protein LINPERHAP1_LOCUS16592 [Linum perenne]